MLFFSAEQNTSTPPPPTSGVLLSTNKPILAFKTPLVSDF